MPYLMQARSSTSGALVTWQSIAADHAGDEFPGPGLPEYVAVAHVRNEDGGGGGGDGLHTARTLTASTTIVSGDDTLIFAGLSGDVSQSLNGLADGQEVRIVNVDAGSHEVALTCSGLLTLVGGETTTLVTLYGARPSIVAQRAGNRILLF